MLAHRTVSSGKSLLEYNASTGESSITRLYQLIPQSVNFHLMKFTDPAFVIVGKTVSQLLRAITVQLFFSNFPISVS